MKHDAFISYSSKDYFPFEVCTSLEKEGLKCWIAPRNIVPGTPYARAIMEGIQGADIILVFISNNSLKSEDVLNEIDNAHGLNKTIVPIFIEDVKLTPEFSYYLKRKQWIYESDHILKDILSLFNQKRNSFKSFNCPKFDRLYTISTKVELRVNFNKSIANKNLYSDIIIGFEPLINFNKQLDFSYIVTENILPSEFISAVNRGLDIAFSLIMAKGINLYGIKATLYDGSYHPINSNTHSFEIVAEDALNKALSKVGISILEPMMRIEIEGDHDQEILINNFINKYNGEIFNFFHFNQRYEVHALMPNNEIATHYQEININNISINTCTFAKYRKGESIQYEL